MTRKEIMKTVRSGALRTENLGKASVNETLSKIENYDLPVTQEREEKPVLTGSDVSALYPSLEPEVSARICYEEMLRTKVEFRSFKVEEAGKFLTAFYDQQPRIMEDQDTRKMRQLLPIRKNKKSNWSGLSKDKDTLWDTSKLFSCNRRDERILLATVVKIMVLTMFYTRTLRS